MYRFLHSFKYHCTKLSGCQHQCRQRHDLPRQNHYINSFRRQQLVMEQWCYYSIYHHRRRFLHCYSYRNRRLYRCLHASGNCKLCSKYPRNHPFGHDQYHTGRFRTVTGRRRQQLCLEYRCHHQCYLGKKHG